MKETVSLKGTLWLNKATAPPRALCVPGSRLATPPSLAKGAHTRRLSFPQVSTNVTSTQQAGTRPGVNHVFELTLGIFENMPYNISTPFIFETCVVLM